MEAIAPDIFLSYNREDQAVARRFAEGFGREGLDVWWDVTLRSGEAYDQVTEQALRSAKAVVVLWSRKSVESRWVRAEATLADRQHTLVPAMIEPCERPIMFELTQTADLCHWQGDAGDAAWRSFLADVRRFIGAAPPARVPATMPGPHAGSGTNPTAAVGRPDAEDLRPSLALLPFTNRSGERADDVFADGMVEDLVAALSLSRMLRVIARSSTLAYRDGVRDVRAIGRDLGVRYLLEGNVRRVGATLRVTAQLVDAASGSILWTQKFDRPLTELAELQESLVVEVAAMLGVQVEYAEIERALKKPGDLNAWEAVVRARVAGIRQSPESLRTAIAEARRAVALAPGYALAHAALAQALALDNWHRTGGRDADVAREARAHADEALAIGASDPFVLSVVAMSLCLTGAWQEGLACSQRAVQLNPGSEAAHTAAVMLCMYLRQPEEALVHLDAAARLNPRGPGASVAWLQRAGAHYMAERYEQALDATRQSLLANPQFTFALKDAVVHLEKLGRRPEAQDALRRLRANDPGTTLELWEARHQASLLHPETSAEMFRVFRDVWLATPEAPAAA
ncbi:MAG: TIR domain-containing protein [Steroidobacteraceae bacterium]